MEFGAAMSVADAAALGKAWYADRFDDDWQPKTAEVIRQRFRAVGLVGEFWSVP